ncbi:MULTISPECIES: CaiB/BaiF CoA transferase family protein [unclassified Streptomyces]|uniref:CaiB/BaiF CoA transferase family protein n=1 Tax=unclassified Streptomyces TaxID=2593676 RepID=UPI00382EFC3F
MIPLGGQQDDSVCARMPLSGITVVDVSTLFAGPYAAQLLADFGAEVIKVEHPSGDPLRRFGQSHDGVPLLWKVLNRNKKCVTLDLKRAEDKDRFLAVVRDADILIENFRPGTLERWGLGPDVLREANPALVVTRVTAFGQDGPYAGRPGFGTIAEAMSGLASMSGEPDGAPLLPPFPLGDALAGLHAALACMIALHARGRTGRGQIADVAITEAVIGALGAQITGYDKAKAKPARVGNGSTNNAPRNVYRCADGTWVAVSAPAQSVAERVITLVGRPDLVDEPWFATGTGRVRHRTLIDELVGGWIADRDRDEVVAAFDRAEAAVAPVYEVDDVLDDPHFRAREVAVRVPDGELGTVLMQNVPFRLSETPGRVRWAGPPLGAHTDELLARLSAEQGTTSGT